jgi:drug/metabolite transporter (DMT)-like permease
MTNKSSDIQSLLYGLLGVIGFSLTLPATRLALVSLDPTFVGLGRALVAAALAAIALWIARAPRPMGRQWLRLGAVALGVVVGFPLFSSWALARVPASHAAVVIGVLPLVTALFGAWLAAERPSGLFWLSTIVASMVISVFALAASGGGFEPADIALFAAVIAAGFGYAEGARLARELGAWQTISWALLVSVPWLIVPVIDTFPADLAAVGWSSVAGFAYVSIVSMFLAFIAWYKALAMGGIGRVGQIQLLQPFFTLAVAAVFLNEEVSAAQMLVALVVLICVFVGRRARVVVAAV